MKRFISIFFSFLVTTGFAQSTDLRDAFTGLYECTNLPFPGQTFYILVEKKISTTDSIVITDSLWSTGSSPGCPVPCYKHQTKLNADSTWSQGASYNGHFKKTDTIHLHFMAPSVTPIDYDGKKIAPVGLFTLNNKETEWYLFPNPASKELNIVLPGLAEEMELQLMDVNGRMVTKQAFKGTAQLDVAALPKGVYIVRIKGKAVNLAKRVVLVE